MEDGEDFMGDMEVLAEVGEWLHCTDGMTEFYYHPVTKEVQLEPPPGVQGADVDRGDKENVPQNGGDANSDEGLHIIEKRSGWWFCSQGSRKFYVCKETEEVRTEANPPPPFLPAVGPEISEDKAKRVTQELLIETAKKKPGKEGFENWARAVTHLHLSEKRLTHLNLESFPVRGVKTIYAYDNRIVYVSGLSKLRGMENLYLQDNRVYTLEDWSDDLPGLRILHLQGNAVPALAGLTGSVRLEELLIQEQRIPQGLRLHEPTLRAIGGSLRTLDVSRNGLRDLTPLRALVRLESLTATDNKVDAPGLYPVLEACGLLRMLFVQGNPLTQKRKWQDEVILRSASVEEIDGKPVGKARAFLQNLNARKVKAGVA
jgi:hypothetical protein